MVVVASTHSCDGPAMKRVTGIGGIFFKSQDPKALGAWYKKHLGIGVEEWGGFGFSWKSAGGAIERISFRRSVRPKKLGS